MTYLTYSYLTSFSHNIVYDRRSRERYSTQSFFTFCYVMSIHATLPQADTYHSLLNTFVVAVYVDIEVELEEVAPNFFLQDGR